MPRIFRLLPLALASGVAMVFSAQSHAIDSTCMFEYGNFPLEFVRDLGTLYVPRDAREGAIIGQTRRRANDAPVGGNRIVCRYEPGSFPTRAELRASRSLAPAPVNPDPQYDPDRLIQTSVPGISAQMEFDSFFTARNGWPPTDGGRPIPPFDSEKTAPNSLAPDMFLSTNAWVTLVKTGPLAPGPHVLLKEVIFTGSFTNIPQALNYSIKATVIQAQCDAGAIGPVQVDLGQWDLSDFTAPGSTTNIVPVTLSLKNCQDDPSNSVATVHAEFTPTNGSAPIGDPADGVFSLSSGASAKGVGIRLLQEDGSPMPLGRPEPIWALPSSGDRDLVFGAHLYQTEDSSQVKPGSVEGMLTFTLTYQ